MPKPVIFYCYPWDLYDVGADIALDQIAEAGATGVSLAMVYHMVTAISPMNPYRTIYYGEDGVVFFQPDKSNYAWTTMIPRASREVDDPDYVKFLMEQSYARRLNFGVWVNFAYNNHLARSHPKAAKVDAFGNPHGAQLTPSSREFRMYCVSLAEDICEQVKPDEFVMQGLSYLPWRYGLSHLKTLSPLTPLQEFLLSLDFSKGTKSIAKKYNIDAEVLQEAVADELRMSFLKRPTTEEMEEEVTPEFVEEMFEGYVARYLICQEAAASLLFENVAKAIRGGRRKLTYTGPTDPIMNGLDLFRIRKSIDRLVVQFPTDREELAAAVKQTREALLETSELMASVSPGDFSTMESFHAHLGALNDAGVDGYFIYNYALLKPEHFDWMKSAKQYWA